jgi:hypothetical protein
VRAQARARRRRHDALAALGKTYRRHIHSDVTSLR